MLSISTCMNSFEAHISIKVIAMHAHVYIKKNLISSITNQLHF